ncbi:MAG: hypothetical protein CMC75_04305 [Flavobacteriaceae bacterium]|nr:hypothetical protein [Flavobacteriaceae bacterium]
MKIKESEIPALDFIIDRIIKDNFPLYANELVSAGFIKSKENYEIESEFEILLSIIDYYNCGTVTDARNEDHGASVIKNGKTAIFKRDGGFLELFNTLKDGVTDYNQITESQNEINNKIDKIIAILEKQNFGQEILFNELQELKELYPKLSKKNWGQVLKGKLIDLGFAQIINQEIAEKIFTELTNQVLRLK